jgi:pimeloyl-ACP methyl ester carboxylesterase
VRITRIAISPRLATRTFENMGGGKHNGRVRRSLSAAAALATLLLLPPAAQGAMHFKHCGAYGFGCARLSVPLDRSGAVPGRVSLLVKRLRARRRPRVGATFVLAGGPGQSATGAFDGDALGQLAATYRNRDLIVYDQRGTGRSGLLRCRGLEHANLLDPGPSAPGCANRLGAARSLYSTAASVDDMEAIRQRIGAAKIAIYGTSYGTKVALAYAIRHPDHVDRLVLDSVVTADGPDPFYRSSYQAAPRALTALCRGRCGSITRDPVADLRTLLGRLSSAPALGRLVSSRGRSRLAAFRHRDLFVVLLAGDLDPALRAGFPGAVRSALNGDAAPLLRLKRRAFQVDAEPPPPSEISSAVYGATSCLDTPFPWSPAAAAVDRTRQADAAIAALPDSAFAPFDRRTSLESDLLALCRFWPGSPGTDQVTGPLPDVPALIVEGEEDLRTPLEDARGVAAQLPHSTLLVAPGVGHSAIGASGARCLTVAFDRFFQGGRLPTRCPRPKHELAPAPVAPTSLLQVRPARGVGGSRGRVIAALAQTLADVNDDALASLIANELDPDLARGGGLRGGSYRLGVDGTLLLKRVQYVPGVRISGRVRAFGERGQRGRVRVAGRGVPGGVLNLRRGRVRGRLGGRRVHARLRPSGVSALTSGLAQSASILR